MFLTAVKMFMLDFYVDATVSKEHKADILEEECSSETYLPTSYMALQSRRPTLTNI
jgi:hypothetical protein